MIEPSCRTTVNLIVCTLLLLTGACASSNGYQRGRSPKLGVDYAVTWIDEQSARRFSVRLESLSKRELCTGPGRWPTSAGYIGGSGLVISAVVGTNVYTYRDTDIEACIFRECTNPMKQGSVLQSILTYDGFKIPPDLWSATKELRFDPQPYWCAGPR
jgi:hypothetical protein